MKKGNKKLSQKTSEKEVNLKAKDSFAKGIPKQEKKEILEKSILQAVCAFDHKKLVAEIKRYLKLGPFTPFELNIISGWYTRIGENDKAIQVVSPELTPDELRSAPLDMLFSQFRLVFLLHTIGARHASKRLEQQIEEVLRERGTNFYEKFDRYYLLKSVMYRISTRPREAIAHSLKGIEYFQNKMQQGIGNYQLNRSLYLGLVVNYADASIAQADYLDARAMVERELNKLDETYNLYRILFHRNLAEGDLRAENIKDCLKNLEVSTSLLDMTAPVIEVAVQYRVWGDYYKFIKEYKKSWENYEQAYQNVLEHHHNPNMGLICLSNIEDLPAIEISHLRRLTLRCYPTYNPVALKAGRLFNPRHHIAYEGYDLNTVNDIWLVGRDEIIPERYQRIMGQFEFLKKFKNKVPWFDLRSGVFGEGGHINGCLPLLQLRALFYVVSSGEIGAPEVALLDYVYQEGVFVATTARERLKMVLSSLKKSGHKIIRRKNFYYYVGHSVFNFIIPMERHHISEHWAFMAQLNHEEGFTRREVEDFYKIHKATAARWIQDWKERKIIKEVAGKTPTYLFISEVENKN